MCKMPNRQYVKSDKWLFLQVIRVFTKEKIVFTNGSVSKKWMWTDRIGYISKSGAKVLLLIDTCNSF